MRFYERVAELESDRTPFATAIVVSRRAPVSSHVGDRAIVFADGRMEGFVGGSCSRDIVRRNAVDALETGSARMVHISPDPMPDERASDDDDGHVYVAMSCASEGAADVYVEPHLPARRLIVVGFTPVANALARGAAALEYDVVRAVDDHELGEFAGTSERAVSIDGLYAFVARLSATERARTSAVVASLGHYDETALEGLLESGLAFIGLVASRKRAARVFAVLAQQGRSQDALATVRNPAGLDIGAQRAEDVAVSILAEIVSSSPLPALADTLCAAAESATHAGSTARATIPKDPICGMDVEIAGSRHHFEAAGTTYYFCCAGCRAEFAADPAAALAAGGKA
jgi:xanthine dehydrogenase accessory factor